MPADVIALPRPRRARQGPDPLAFFVRVGRNDHKEMLDLIGTGEQGIFGFVILPFKLTFCKNSTPSPHVPS